MITINIMMTILGFILLGIIGVGFLISLLDYRHLNINENLIFIFLIICFIFDFLIFKRVLLGWLNVIFIFLLIAYNINFRNLIVFKIKDGGIMDFRLFEIPMADLFMYLLWLYSLITIMMIDFKIFIVTLILSSLLVGFYLWFVVKKVYNIKNIKKLMFEYGEYDVETFCWKVLIKEYKMKIGRPILESLKDIDKSDKKIKKIENEIDEQLKEFDEDEDSEIIPAFPFLVIPVVLINIIIYIQLFFSVY